MNGNATDINGDAVQRDFCIRFAPVVISYLVSDEGKGGFMAVAQALTLLLCIIPGRDF